MMKALKSITTATVFKTLPELPLHPAAAKFTELAD